MIPVRKHVTAASENKWAEAVAKAHNQVSVHNDLRAWTEHFMLPKAVLLAPKERGGEKPKGHLAKCSMVPKLDRWLDADKAALWEEASRRAKKRGAPGTTTVTHGDSERDMDLKEELVIEHLRNGQFSKAAAAPPGAPPAAPTVAVVAEMRSKHTPARAEYLAAAAGPEGPPPSPLQPPGKPTQRITSFLGVFI